MPFRDAEKRRAYQRDYYGQPEARAIRRAAVRRYKEANPELVKRWKRINWLRSYGLTLEQYEAMLAQQDGKCAACRRPPDKTPLNVDHDHRTGKIRELLCGDCNRALGMLRDDPDAIEALLRYIKKWRAR